VRERRFVKGAEVRAAGSGRIDGHAAVFGATYTLADYPDFKVVETIKRGAFSRAIAEEQSVVALFNHDQNFVLGRTPNTLSLSEDWKGLYFSCELPDTQAARDLRTLIQRGDVTGCSFAFEAVKQKRTEEVINKQLVVTRQIEDVNLYDVSPVVTPAYGETDVSARQIDFRSMFHDGAPEVARMHLPELGEILRAAAPFVDEDVREKLRLRLLLLQRL
jgi:HK97 family phage prohead protease